MTGRTPSSSCNRSEKCNRDGGDSSAPWCRCERCWQSNYLLIHHNYWKIFHCNIIERRKDCPSCLCETQVLRDCSTSARAWCWCQYCKYCTCQLKLSNNTIQFNPAWSHSVACLCWIQLHWNSASSAYLWCRHSCDWRGKSLWTPHMVIV